MAKRPSAQAALPDAGLDLAKVGNVHQLGGIRLGTLDAGSAGGGVGALPTRVAFVDTGAGLRFVVALDRGGDIIDAAYNQHGLAYLSPNGLLPPNQAYHSGFDWLYGWAGGLLTTCGPQYVGGVREEDGATTTLHGRYSNQSAGLESVINPDLRRGRLDMSITLVTIDSRMFGPVIEIRRTLRATLGRPELTLHDTVTNLGNQRCAHHYLYHVNFGYPFLDRGSKLFYRGKAETYWQTPDVPADMPAASVLEKLKSVPDALPEHASGGERGTILRPTPDAKGLVHAGLINRARAIGVELEYPAADLPRLANWQHFGPSGSYVTGVEPFFGSLLGKAKDPHPGAEQYLAPGQSRQYTLTLRVHEGKAALDKLSKLDGPVKP